MAEPTDAERLTAIPPAQEVSTLDAEAADELDDEELAHYAAQRAPRWGKGERTDSLLIGGAFMGIQAERSRPPVKQDPTAPPVEPSEVVERVAKAIAETRDSDAYDECRTSGDEDRVIARAALSAAGTHVSRGHGADGVDAPADRPFVSLRGRDFHVSLFDWKRGERWFLDRQDEMNELRAALGTHQAEALGMARERALAAENALRGIGGRENHDNDMLGAARHHLSALVKLLETGSK